MIELSEQQRVEATRSPAYADLLERFLADERALAQLRNEAARLKDILRAALPVVAYVSTGRRFVDVEPYPDAAARKVAALIDDEIGLMQP